MNTPSFTQAEVERAVANKEAHVVCVHVDDEGKLLPLPILLLYIRPEETPERGGQQP